MKAAAIATLVLVLAGGVPAGAGVANKVSWRVADSTNTCLINCASGNKSCKRLCPTTYNVPCISACDNQAQFCRQACERR